MKKYIIDGKIIQVKTTTIKHPLQANKIYLGEEFDYNINLINNLQLKDKAEYTWVNWFAEVESIGNVQILGQLLYTYYFVFFLIAGLILFVAVLGALTLTLTLNKTIKKNDHDFN